MTNNELVEAVRDEYKYDRKRLLETARPCDIYEIYVKYEILCWLEDIADDDDKYYVEICDELKKIDFPLDFMFVSYRDGDNDTRDKIFSTVFDAVQWRKDYGED